MQRFINFLIELGDKYGLDAELVIVEWNPPSNRPLLKDALTWPKSLNSLKVRIIEVPNEIHQIFPNSEKIPLFEYIAKNTGIQRARGEFILSTNPDILFNDELIKFLASKSLSKDCFYRIDRRDVKKKIPFKCSIQEQLKFCEKNIFQVNLLYGTFSNEMLSLMESFQSYFKRFKKSC